MKTIAIIGAGFSGTLLALHLLRRCPATAINLIERSVDVGSGQAYSTGNPSHLLNVRVGGMSAFRDRADDFLNWLNDAPERYGEARVTAGGFVPRRVFGTYVRSLLAQELARCNDPHRLQLIQGDAVDLSLQSGRSHLRLASGRMLQADIVVLATGNVPSLPPPIEGAEFYDSASYRPDPWAPDALHDLPPDAPVLLIGSGLTAMDVVMSLLGRGHRGRIQSVSRRGLLPQRHGSGAPMSGTAEAAASFPSDPLALLRRLRRDARVAAVAGQDWRPVIDAIRPFTTDIWQLMPLDQRARFLRHLRPWWDTHRHRMAPAVADRIDAARAAGQFVVRAGRILRIDGSGADLEVRYRPRGQTETGTLPAARVINCSGPGADYARIADPMMRSLLQQGLARPDALRLGLDATANCALRAEDGAVSRHLFAVGPLTRGMFWEMTAVPDIRRQCELLAAHLAGLLPPAESPAPLQPEPEMFVI